MAATIATDTNPHEILSVVVSSSTSSSTPHYADSEATPHAAHTHHHHDSHGYGTSSSSSSPASVKLVSVNVDSTDRSPLLPTTHSTSNRFTSHHTSFIHSYDRFTFCASHFIYLFILEYMTLRVNVLLDDYM